MTTFNTGNPIGSPDPRDLYDNAQVIDDYANSEAGTTTDRLGVERATIAGIDAAARSAIAQAGYEFIGDYAAGIELTAYNQVVREAGEFWRVSGAIDLPYTTTGAGMPEGGAFVTVGDATLREEFVAHEESAGNVHGIPVEESAEWQAQAQGRVDAHAAEEGDVHGIPVGERALHTGENVGGTPVGGYVAVQTNLTGAEEPDPDTHIKLTANDSYNTGKLDTETITGTAPLVVATAVIVDTESPLSGQVVNLLNTENRFVEPGENAGAVANDVMQQITGQIHIRAGGSGQSGAFASTTTSGDRSDGSLASDRINPLRFDSSNSPNSRTSDHTDVKHIEATYYMRVK